MCAQTPTVLTRNRALHMLLVKADAEKQKIEQKILQDAVAALQRNDPALKKLELGELRACSWPARALRLFLGAAVMVALGTVL